jgi:hypothetical protein
VKPFHVRRSPYKCRMHSLGGYIFKEYSGARQKVWIRGIRAPVGQVEAPSAPGSMARAPAGRGPLLAIPSSPPKPGANEPRSPVSEFKFCSS